MSIYRQCAHRSASDPWHHSPRRRAPLSLSLGMPCDSAPSTGHAGMGMGIAALLGGRGEHAVLKITITKTPTEQRWVLEGRQMQPWPAELERQWWKTHGARQGRTCVDDLHDVASIDPGGTCVILSKGPRIERTLRAIRSLARMSPSLSFAPAACRSDLDALRSPP